MSAILLSLLLTHGSNSAHFTVTCTVIRRFTYAGTTIAYVSDQPLTEPRIIDGTITF